MRQLNYRHNLNHTQSSVADKNGIICLVYGALEVTHERGKTLEKCLLANKLSKTTSSSSQN
jgi:hypothetical protein